MIKKLTVIFILTLIFAAGCGDQEGEDLDNNPETLDIMVFDNRTLRSKTMTVEIEEDKDKSSVIYYAVNE